MINYFKNIKYYKFYKSVIRGNYRELTLKFNLRRDFANRLYTIINLDTDVDVYGADLTQKQLTTYIRSVDNYLADKKLQELVGLEELRKIDEYNYLVVFSFSLFDTRVITRNKIALITFGIIISSIILSIKYFL